MSEETEYVYTDEKSNPLYKQIRVQDGEEKTFYSMKYANREWKRGLDGVKRVLYNLPSIIKAISETEKIYFVEGEKDVETLKEKGLVGTTIAGRRKW